MRQLYVGDVEVVSLVHKTQPNRVDEYSPILAKAASIESSRTADRDYLLLDADAATETDLSHLSLQQSDSLSTTISEESDSVHVYDLNKRETKILRHGIIKLSRNPIGEYDDTTHTDSRTGRLSASPSSPLESTIQQFNRKIFEHAKETRKPPISPTKLKSVHLNRNPRKFKMADMHLGSEEAVVDGTHDGAISTMIETSSTRDDNNVEIVEKTVENETRADGSVVTVTTEVLEITKHLLEHEREESAIAVVTAVERKSSVQSEHEEQTNAAVEVSHEETKSSNDAPHAEEVFETSHEEASHTDGVVGRTETILVDESPIQRVLRRKLTDAEIVFDKVIDYDDAANVEIIPAVTRESFEYVPVVDHSETHTSVVIDGNVTTVRESQLEVVIVSPSHSFVRHQKSILFSSYRFRQPQIQRSPSSKRMSSRLYRQSGSWPKVSRRPGRRTRQHTCIAQRWHNHTHSIHFYYVVIWIDIVRSD